MFKKWFFLTSVVAGVAMLAGVAVASFDVFYGSGSVFLNYDGVNNDGVGGLAVAPNGDIFVGGSIDPSSTLDTFMAASLLSTGDLNTSFGGGIVATNVTPTYTNWATTCCVQPSDGKLILAGTSGSKLKGGWKEDFTLVRYNTNGTLDSMFGSKGIVRTAVSSTGNDQIMSIVLQPDGKIVAIGNSFSGNPLIAQMVRYTSSGALDTTFGKNGIVTISNPTYSCEATAVALQGNSQGTYSIIVGIRHNGTGVQNSAVYRYTSAGILDTSFGSGGSVTFALPPTGYTDSIVWSLAVDPVDESIFAAGQSNSNVTGLFVPVVVKFSSNGVQDETFGGSGFASLEDPPGISGGSFDAIAIQSNGQVVAASRAIHINGTVGTVIARFNTDGSPDTSFGTGGYIIPSVQFEIPIGGGGMVLQPSNENIVVSGWGLNGGTVQGIWVQRYLPDGTLDTTF